MAVVMCFSAAPPRSVRRSCSARRGSVGEARAYSARMLAQAALARRHGLVRDVRYWLEEAALGRREALVRSLALAGPARTV